MRIATERASALSGIAVAEILDAGLEELVAAFAALAKHLAQIGIAARRAGLANFDVVEADRNGEFRPQAEAAPVSLSVRKIRRRRSSPAMSRNGSAGCNMADVSTRSVLRSANW
jgi:hypothetical protein